MIERHRVFQGRIVAGFLLMCMAAGGCRRRTDVEPTLTIHPDSVGTMRVLLFDKISGCTLSSPDGFTAEAEDPAATAKFSPDGSDLAVTLNEGRIQIGIHRFGRRVWIRPIDRQILVIDNQRYRGLLLLASRDDGNGIDGINVLSLEAYLAGVIGAEMPSYWEAEALKAQTIVSRTYSLYIQRRFGIGRDWDVRRTQANQVYRGMAAETQTIREAVESTRGMALTVPGIEGTPELFPAYFSSTCAGHSENSVHVFGDRFGPLEGVSCPYCTSVSRRSFLNWPSVDYTVQEVSRRLIERYPNLSALEFIDSIEPTRISRYDGLERITQVRLIGRNGKTDTLRAEDLRLAIDPTGKRLKSTSFSLRKEKDRLIFEQGKGFGHGVGMCQYGAEGMAREGYSCEAILAFYFPGSRIHALKEIEKR